MTTPTDKPLSRDAELMGRRLLKLPLASTEELRAGTGLSAKRARAAVKELDEGKFQDSAELGCRLPAVRRRWLLDKGLNHFGASAEERSWHSEAGLGNQILYHLPKVEAVNSVASKLSTEDWLLSATHWYRNQEVMAAAEYINPRGLVAYRVFAQASAMDKPEVLYYLLQGIPSSVQAQCEVPDAEFRPSGLCIVADSEWWAGQALSMAWDILHGWVDGLEISAWYYGHDGWYVSNGRSVRTGRPPEVLQTSLEPTLWLPQVMNTKRLRKNERLSGILERCPWTGRAGHSLSALLAAVGDFPVGAPAHYRALLGEGKKGKEVFRRLDRLMDLGYVEIVTHNARATARRLPRGVPVTIARRGQGADRLALTKKGRILYCQLFGGKQADLAARTQMGTLRSEVGDAIEDRWPYRHQDGLYEVLCQFCEMGSSVAPGWQVSVTLADQTTFSPDGVVLAWTPWGQQWCYIEFELSDMSYRALKARSAKYASPHRMDDRPVLFVCQTDRAEENLHKAGRDFAQPPRMLSTTLARLKVAGVAGAGVWSRYGEPVTLTARDPALG